MATLLVALMAIGCNTPNHNDASKSANETKASYNALSVPTNIIDLGSISPEDIVSVSTKISNGSGTDIKLTEIATDCSCVSAVASSDIVRGNGSTRLKLEYDAQGTSGKQFHKVIIDADNGQKVEIIVVADVE